jgi:hypothetical protein
MRDSDGFSGKGIECRSDGTDSQAGTKYRPADEIPSPAGESGRPQPRKAGEILFNIKRFELSQG